jgi:hypothetical protein
MSVFFAVGAIFLIVKKKDKKENPIGIVVYKYFTQIFHCVSQGIFAC